MNVEIGAEAAQFPEKEHLNGIAVAVWTKCIWDKAFLTEVSLILDRKNRRWMG